HMSRIIDRARAINTTPDQDPNKAALKATLPHLKLRATLVNRAIYWAVARGISTCLLMLEVRILGSGMNPARPSCSHCRSGYSHFRRSRSHAK
ncbi:MAG: DUF2721 domain-containing protein, partial [Pseudolabrys sp.]